MADIKFISGEGMPRVVVVKAVLTTVGDGGWSYGATQVFSANIGVNYGVRTGMRVASWKVIAGQPNKYVWGKVTAIAPGDLTVDQWVGGTPTDLQIAYIDGWVIDLPFCDDNHLTEQFTPDQLIHNLYRSRKEGKFFGWKYEAKLSYEAYIEADVLLSLRPALNMNENDRLILIPRADRATRQYNVLHGGAIKLARHVDRGHKFVVFTFQGKEDVPFPIPQSGYGYGYATHYGTQL